MRMQSAGAKFPAVPISAICSTPVGDLSQCDVNSALMKSALAAFGFTQTFCKSVPGKFALCGFWVFSPLPSPLFCESALSRDQHIFSADLHYPMPGL